MKDPLRLVLDISIGSNEATQRDEQFPVTQENQSILLTLKRLLVYMHRTQIISDEELRLFLKNVSFYLFGKIYNVHKKQDEELSKYVTGDTIYIPQNILILEQEQILYLKLHFDWTETYGPIRTIQMELEAVKFSVQQLQSQVTLNHTEVTSQLQPLLKPKPDPTSNIDIIILYSNPLIQKPNFQLIPPVGYYKEISNIEQALGGSEKEITYRIYLATIENMHKAVHEDPKIIHFIGHGAQEQESQKYYLAFEANGWLKKIYQNELQDIFEISNGQNNTNLKLVILSCCHSGEIAKKLQEAGVPAVIAVSSEYQIEDTVSINFSHSLYQHLLMGKDIDSAIKFAKQSLKTLPGLCTCCCVHTHYKNCRYQSIKWEPDEDPHTFHTAKCSCNKKNQYLHYFSYDKPCKWALKFLSKLLGYDNPAELQNDFNVMEAIIKYCKAKYLFMCCCYLSQMIDQTQQTPSDQYDNQDCESQLADSIERLTHDESQKFQLYSNNQNQRIVLFNSHRPGKERQLNNHRPMNFYIVGRQQEVQIIFDELQISEAKWGCFIVGSRYQGKSLLIKQSIEYFQERVQDVISFEFQLSQLSTYLIKDVTNANTILKNALLDLMSQILDRNDPGVQPQNQVVNQNKEQQIEWRFQDISKRKNQERKHTLLAVFEDTNQLDQETLVWFADFVQRLNGMHYKILLSSTQPIPQLDGKLRLIHLREFKRNDIFEYLQKELQKRGMQINEPDIQDLMDMLKKHDLIAKPGVLLKLIDIVNNKRGQANFGSFIYIVKELQDKDWEALKDYVDVRVA